MLSSFASDAACIATLAQFSLADSWSLSPTAAPVSAYPLCKRRAKMGACPLGWISTPGAQGRCYLPQSDVQRTYAGAKVDCAALGQAPPGALGGGSTPQLSIWETPSEASSVMSDVIPQSNDAVFYVDLVRDWDTPHGFRWGGASGGGPALSAFPGFNWNNFQPSNFGGVQGHVVALAITPTVSGLSDVDGRVDHRGYLCESAPGDAADYSLAQLLSRTGRSGDTQNIKHVNDCPPGWTQHGHRCFQARRPAARQSFTQARATCAGLAPAAELASVEGTTDDVFQRSLYLSLPSASTSDFVFTGAEYVVDATTTSNSVWTWVDGGAWDTLASPQPVGLQNNDHLFFNLGEPSDTYFEAVTVRSSGVTAHGFVCAQPLVSPGGCAEGWVRDHRPGSSDCWMLGTHRLFQAEGEVHCRAMGGQLASLHSEGDRSVAQQLMSPSSLAGDTMTAFIAPVDDVAGDRFGPFLGGQPAYANYTLKNADMSVWDFSTWGGSLPDTVVRDLPARVQLMSSTGRMASTRAPAADRSGYICRAAAAASKRWRPPPALTGGGTTTADTGTDSDFETTTSDPSLAAYGFMGNVYRTDEPCPFGGGWVPVNSWCYKALPMASGMSRGSAEAACTTSTPGAMLAPLAEYGEGEAAGVVTAVANGQRVWFGCSVRNAPGQPGHGEVFLDDGTPLKYANWGSGFNASTDLQPGWGCTLYVHPSAGVPLWRMEPPSAVPGVQYGAVCAVRAVSSVHGPETCGLGWRYVKNADDDAAYCFSNIRQRSLYREAADLCDAQGATVGAIVDMEQSERLDTFFRHPLVSSEETYWIGIVRMQNAGAGCAWGNVNTGELLGNGFTRWEVPDVQGNTCSAPGTYVRITRLWGIPMADNQRRSAVCQLRAGPDLATRAVTNPRGFVAFVPPVQAGAFFAEQLSGAPPGTNVCAFLAGDAAAYPVLLTMTSTDSEGWSTGWQVTIGGATISRSPLAGLPAALRLSRGHTSQTYLCLRPIAPSTTCPTISVLGGGAGSDGNIVVTITDAQPAAAGQQAAGSPILAHGRGGGAPFEIALPGVPACVQAQPSNNPTPAATATSAAIPSAAGTAAVTPSQTPSQTPTASIGASPSASRSAAPTQAAMPSGGSTPAATAGSTGGQGGGSGGAGSTPVASTGSGPNEAGGGGGTTGGAPGAQGNDSDTESSRDETTPLVVSLVVVLIVLVAFGVFWHRRKNAARAPKTIAHNMDTPKSLQYSASAGPGAFGGAGMGYPPMQGGIEMGSAGVVNPLSNFNNGSGAHRAASVHGRSSRVTQGQRRALPPGY